MTLKVIKRLENMFKTEKCKSWYVTYLVECSGCWRQYPIIKRNMQKYDRCYVCANREKAINMKLWKISKWLYKRSKHKRDHFSHKLCAIKWRCSCPSTHWYKNYWWRGIKCEWLTLAEFKRDMYDSYLEHVAKYWEDNTTIDRIDVNWNYCKENCRWVTMKEQQSSKRTNIKVEYKWKQYPTLDALCKEKWLRYGTIYRRITKYWMSIEDAIDTPIRKRMS